MADFKPDDWVMFREKDVRYGVNFRKRKAGQITRYLGTGYIATPGHNGETRHPFYEVKWHEPGHPVPRVRTAKLAAFQLHKVEGIVRNG